MKTEDIQMYPASPQPAMDDVDAASLQAAMEAPITALLGPTGPLLRKLHSIGPEHGLPDEIGLLRVLCIPLKNMSEAEKNASFIAKCWMKIVRELCYDTEDYLYEVMLSRPGSQHDFSELVARMKDAVERRQRFLWSPDISSRLTSQMSLDLPVPVIIPVHVDIGGGHSIVRVVEPPNKLLQLLGLHGDEKRLKVIPIFGVSGVGKTTVARSLYHKHGRGFQCRAFVSMSRNPDIRGFLTSVLLQLKAPWPHGFPDVPDLIDAIGKHLQGKRYFIIVDDLWTASVWDIISRAFPDGDYCSRIITTTQINDVALACCSYYSEYIYEMGLLNDDESRKLFFGSVFGSEDDCPTDIKQVSYEIVKKCGGLPLATVHVASLLASQPNLEQWKEIRNSLPPSKSANPASIVMKELFSDEVIGSASSLLAEDPELKKWEHIQNSAPTTFEWLKEVVDLIYNNFPSRLKTCLLYFSMYPEGSVIKKDDLVKQWVAEGFLSDVEGRDTEEIAEGYFDELVIRGMIQAVDTNYKGEVLSCTVHQMVLDLIRYKSMEENFVITVDCFQSTLALPDKVRRLSVQFGGAKSANLPESIVTSQVRSLTFWGLSKCVPLVMYYGLLRVLVLHIWADRDKEYFDLTGIAKLYQLRYLKIECNITVNLPDKIQRLQCLRILQVDARLCTVPPDIVQLEKLLHLRLPSKSILPHGVGQMTSLRTLGYFDLGSNSEDNVMDLCKLANLQDLYLTCSTEQSAENLEKNMQLLGSILEKLGNLQSLTLVPAAGSSSMSISCDGLISMFPAPARLQRLDLLPRICIFASLPGRIGELSRLSILKIAVRELSMNDIVILRGLPALTALSLSAREVEWLIFDNRGFRVLEYFKLMYTAPCLSFLEGAMPSVQKLRIGFNANRVKQHSWKIFGFQHLTSLREISIKLGGISAHESDNKRRAFLSGLIAAVDHQNTHTVNITFVDHEIFCDKYYGTQDEVPDLPPNKDEVSGEGENNLADIGITAPSESSSHLPIAGEIGKSKHSAHDKMLEITGEDDLHSLDQVFEFYDLTKVEKLTLKKCPPLELKHLLMLTLLKTLVFESTDRLFVPTRGHGDVELQFPVEHVVVRKLFGATGKELTELLTHLPRLSKLEFWRCENITHLTVGADLQEATSAAASDSEVEQEKEEDGLLFFPPHLSDSLRELIIWDCPELVLVEETRRDRDSKTETRRGGFQALRSLQELHIWLCPMFLSACLYSSPSLHLFPSSLQSLHLWLVKVMGTLEPLSNLTSLTSFNLRDCGENLRCEGLGPLLTTGGQLSELVVLGSPRFFSGWDPNPRRVLQDDEGEKKQQLQLVPLPPSSSKLQELWTGDAAGFLAAPICSLLSSSLTKLTLYGTKEMERFSKEQEDALLLLASLQELGFLYFPTLQHLPAGLHKLTNLKQLVIYKCPAVRTLPKDGLPKSLQELNVNYCDNEELKQHCRGLVGTIPEIYAN